MSAPRISVTYSWGLFAWCCTDDVCVERMCALDEEASLMDLQDASHETIAAAADAGRAHLAAHHTAQMPPLTPVDPEPVYVAPGPHTARPGHDWDFPCCNPIQRTYEESRSDA